MEHLQLTLFLIIQMFIKGTEELCQNFKPLSECTQIANDGECYFTASYGCSCTESCQSMKDCATHPSNGDGDCFCKSPHVYSDCVANGALCPLTCSLRDSVTCDSLPTVANATHSFPSPRYLDVVTYDCDLGFYLDSGDIGKRVCIEDGSWFIHVLNGTLPVCKEVPCGTSPAVSNATPTMPNGVYGDVISYSCDAGYEKVSGQSGSQFCNETGHWEPAATDADPPVCQEVPCGTSPAVSNATPTMPNGVYGDVISYSCDAGYEKVSGQNGSLFCNETGHWEPAATDSDAPVCQEVPCGTSPAVSNATPTMSNGVYGDVISYSCDAGYEKVSGQSGSMFCNETGYWEPAATDADPPVCKKVRCGTSPAVSNATPTMSNGMYGDFISYSCDVGYEKVSGQNGSLFCNETGHWEPAATDSDAPVCQEVPCGTSPAVSNATPTMSNGVYGDVISYSCDAGYEKVSGQSGSLLCNETGDWEPAATDADAPVCQEVPCGTSPAVSNATPTMSNGVYGDVISYSCDAGYEKVSGQSGSLLCNETGHWEPAATEADPPVCQEVTTTTTITTTPAPTTTTTAAPSTSSTITMSSAATSSTATVTTPEPIASSVIITPLSTTALSPSVSSTAVTSSILQSIFVTTSSVPPSPEMSPSTSTITSVSSVQPTTTLTESVSSVQPTSTLTESVSSVQPTATLTESVSPVQPTTALTGSVSSMQPTTTLTESVSSVQPTTTLTESVSSVQPTTPSTESSVTPLSIITSYFSLNDSNFIFVQCSLLNGTRARPSDSYTEQIPITKKFVPELKEAEHGEAFGAVAIIVLVSCALCIVIIDLMSFGKHYGLFKKNMSAIFHRLQEKCNANDIVHYELKHKEENSSCVDTETSNVDALEDQNVETSIDPGI